MSQAELPTYFPQTEFIGQVAEGMHPLGVDLVRATYLGYYFGQHDKSLTRQFGETAAQEVYFWLPHEKSHYPEVREQVADFFREEGADRLARVDGDDVLRIGREHYIDEAWRTCNANLPSQEQLDKTPPLHHFLIRAEDDITFRDLLGVWGEIDNLKQEWVDAVRFMREFLTVDAMQTNKGGSLGHPRPSHQSLFREAVLRGQQTGSGAFNLLFSSMRDHTAGGLAKAHLKQLGSVWSWHHSETFLPDEYKVIAESQPLRDRMLYWVVRKMVAKQVCA
ncbi:MAG TPA: hypothetical protein VF733_04080 [Candidatus Saccharimonadales bacterium]